MLLTIVQLEMEITCFKGMDRSPSFVSKKGEKRNSNLMLSLLNVSIFFFLISNQVSIKPKGTPKYTWHIQKKHLTGKRKKILKKSHGTIKAATVPTVPLINDSQQHVQCA
jgi:hypothetical protein